MEGPGKQVLVCNRTRAERIITTSEVTIRMQCCNHGPPSGRL